MNCRQFRDVPFSKFLSSIMFLAPFRMLPERDPLGLFFGGKRCLLLIGRVCLLLLRLRRREEGRLGRPPCPGHLRRSQGEEATAAHQLCPPGDILLLIREGPNLRGANTGLGKCLEGGGGARRRVSSAIGVTLYASKFTFLFHAPQAVFHYRGGLPAW